MILPFVDYLQTEDTISFFFDRKPGRPDRNQGESKLLVPGQERFRHR